MSFSSTWTANILGLWAIVKYYTPSWCFDPCWFMHVLPNKHLRLPY